MQNRPMRAVFLRDGGDGFDLFAPTRATHLLRIRVANGVDYDRAYQEPFRRLFERAVHWLAVNTASA